MNNEALESIISTGMTLTICMYKTPQTITVLVHNVYIIFVYMYTTNIMDEYHKG